MISVPKTVHTGTASPGAGGEIGLLDDSDSENRRRHPQCARERAPARALAPEQRTDEQRRQRRVAGKRILGRHVEDGLRQLQRDDVGDDRDDHHEGAAGGDLNRLSEARLPSVEREHVLGEHRRQGKNLRVARHHRRHDRRSEQRGEPERRVAVDQPQNDVVACGTGAEPVALIDRKARTGIRECAPRVELRRDRRHVPRGVGRHAQKHRRQPDEQHANGVQDDGLLEVPEALRRHAEDADVRERDRRERNERVAEEIQHRHPLAAEQRRRGRRGEQRLHRAAETAHAAADHDDCNRAEQKKERGLERVDPRGAAHAAEEDVAHDDERDDGAAQPIRHQPAADSRERGAAAHDRDDDVGNEQHRLDDEDQRADVRAFPPVAEHLDRRDESVAASERPQPGAEHKKSERDDERRRRRHQAEGHDAVREGVARGAQDGERRHVGAEQRQQEHHRPERSAGEEVVLRRAAAARRSEREDADVQRCRQVGEDDRRRNHRFGRAADPSGSPSFSRCSGQAKVTSSHSRPAQAAVNAAW